MKNKTTKLMLSLLAIVILLHLLSLFTVAYLTWPITSLTLEKASALGGSFGVLGTLFSGLAFWGLIWTILIQQGEIRRQRIDAKRARISDLLLNEARLCLSDLNNAKFTVNSSVVFPTDRPFNQWQYFYHAMALMGASCENEISNQKLINELTSVVMSNIEQFTYFYRRLDQACDVARYLLADSEIPIKELSEIKLLFFSHFDRDIFLLSGVMESILGAVIKKANKKQKHSVFDPFRSILTKIGSINQFANEEVNDKSIKSWQWIFEKQSG